MEANGMKLRAKIAVILLTLVVTWGCSNGGALPTSPGEETAREISTGKSHQLWGYWQFTADPEAGTLEATPLRIAGAHLNVLPFLEFGSVTYLTLESVEFIDDIIEARIGIIHPFPGLVEFTGFDVSGILISKGSIGGFSDSDICIPGWNNFRLLNPDGYSRWWNPSEFPINDGSFTCYKDGRLGAPHSYGHYNATLNGYKYYCDNLNHPYEPMSGVNPLGRGTFGPGKKIVREYIIRMGTDGLIFNYAVDACWEFPEGGPPWTISDFPEAANRSEPWWIDVEIMSNSLWNTGSGSGGSLKLSVDVYDWFNAGLNTLGVESPGNFDAAIGITPSGGGTGYSTYAVDITDATPAEGQIQVLITAECEDMGFDGFIPGVNTAAYQVLRIEVSEESLEDLVAYATIEINNYFGGFGPSGTSDDPVPTEWYFILDGSGSTGPIEEYLWEIDGDDSFDDFFGEMTNAWWTFPGVFTIKLKVTNGGSVSDIYEFPDPFYCVKGTYVSCQSC